MIQREFDRFAKPRFEWKPRHIPAHPLSVGLVSHFLLNEPANAPFDCVRNVFATPVNNPGRGVSRMGIGYSFNGSNQYVLCAANHIGTPFNFAGRTECTISVWCTATAFTPERKLFGLWDDAGPRQYLLLFTTTGVGMVARSDSAGVFVEGPLPAANRLTHVAGTARWGGQLRVYRDGQLIGSEPLPSHTFQNSTATGVAIGTGFNSYPTLAHPHGGLILDVRFYSRELSPAEIWMLYQDPFCDMDWVGARKWWDTVAAGGAASIAALASRSYVIGPGQSV